MRRSVFSSLLVIAFCPLVGCQTLNQHYIDRDFPGLQSAMQKPIVCLLFVHGIGGYSNNDPANILQCIGQMPGMRQSAASHDVQFADGATAGTLKRQDFVNTTNGHELRCYTLDWEPVTAPLKAQLLGYDQEQAHVTRRLPLDNLVRSRFMDDGIPDVVLYVGQYKAAMQRTVKQALRQIHRELLLGKDPQTDYGYVFVTWSLGSKIVFDCLADAHPTLDQSPAATTQAAADLITFHKIAEKTHSVFMLANQIPLLTLGDIKSPSRTNEPPATMPYQNLLKVARLSNEAATQPATQPQKPAVSIVAFSDPNDLFSYPIPAWLEETNEAQFANVYITVSRKAYYIPLVGWIINPVSAHTGYGIDDKVVDLILHGGKATAN